MAAAAERPVREEPRTALVPVPDVTAYYDYFAADALAGSGFEVVYVRDYREGFAARGVTWATEPAAGTLAPEGSTVTVYATPQDLPPRPGIRAVCEARAAPASGSLQLRRAVGGQLRVLVWGRPYEPAR